MAFLPFVLMFVIFWFLLIRPQQKKMKEQLDMQSNLQRGEEVVTTSGIIGKITGVAERVVTLEIADNVRVKFLRSQISTVVKGDQQLS
jgi:preprotein translocase subunit YajC